MTGPEHYREAERLLELAQHPRRLIEGEQPAADVPDGTRFIFDGEAYVEEVGRELAAAQVHATLAQVAATVGERAERPPSSGTLIRRHGDDWKAVLG